MHASQKQLPVTPTGAQSSLRLDPRFATREEVSLVLDWISCVSVRLDAADEPNCDTDGQ